MLELIKIPLENKIVVLKVTDFDGEIDVDDILKIDYSNILGEILTFPVLLNRLGLLLADAEDMVKHTKFDLEVYRAELKERYKKNLRKVDGSGGAAKMKAPTNDEVEWSVLQDTGNNLKSKKLFKVEKYRDYLNSLYWSAKSKDDKLNKISEKLRPSEFEDEIMEGTINGIMIKCFDKLTKNKY